MQNLSQSGRSMVEMLGVLAIIGVLSVGAISGYSKAMDKYLINQTIDQISNIVANIRTLFSTTGYYNDFKSAKSLIFPENVGATCYWNTWCQGITPMDTYMNLSSSYADSADKTNETYKAFILEYNGLSKDNCVALATADWGNRVSGLIGVSVRTYSSLNRDGPGGQAGYLLENITVETTDGNNYVSIPGAATPNHATPMNVAKAVGLCSSEDEQNSFAVKFH
jgi:type II secretory pathway pseudopilin PulG